MYGMHVIHVQVSREERNVSHAVDFDGHVLHKIFKRDLGPYEPLVPHAQMDTHTLQVSCRHARICVIYLYVYICVWVGGYVCVYEYIGI